jgi:hypothetical protein
MHDGGAIIPYLRRAIKMAANEIVETYMAAWNETDEAKRRGLIDTCWNEAGTYTDPLADVTGREALAATIAGFHAQMPGATIDLTTGIDQHHDRIRFGWKLVGGPQEIEGIDVGVIAADGRLASITGFWGVNPPPV